MNIYKTKEIRKKESIDKLKVLGIDYIENLPVTYEANEVNIKSYDEIVKRYIANIISIQVAFDILNDAEKTESIKFFTDLLNKYNVTDSLNEMERKVFNNELETNELINLTWQYEALNVLSWILGLKSELEFPSNVCDVNALIEPIATSNSFEEFFSKCNVIDIEDILDELDLEYRYHWAVVDKRINSSTNCGDLNEDIVVERCRALEWLFDEEKDWNKLSLDT